MKNKIAEKIYNNFNGKKRKDINFHHLNSSTRRNCCHFERQVKKIKSTKKKLLRSIKLIHKSKRQNGSWEERKISKEIKKYMDEIAEYSKLERLHYSSVWGYWWELFIRKVIHFSLLLYYIVRLFGLV